MIPMAVVEIMRRWLQHVTTQTVEHINSNITIIVVIDQMVCCDDVVVDDGHSVALSVSA